MPKSEHLEIAGAALLMGQNRLFIICSEYVVISQQLKMETWLITGSTTHSI